MASVVDDTVCERDYDGAMLMSTSQDVNILLVNRSQHQKKPSMKYNIFERNTLATFRLSWGWLSCVSLVTSLNM